MNKNKESKNKWEDFMQKEEPPKGTSKDDSKRLAPNEEQDSMVSEDSGSAASSATVSENVSLEEQLAAKNTEIRELQERLLREYADIENSRRRFQRDMESSIKFANDSLVEDLLPVVDSLLRGLASTDIEDPHVKNLREGLSLTLSLLDKTLEKYGVSVIEPKVGDAFNPQLHEALAVQTHATLKANTVLEVIERGYQLHGRVLRAARVLVTKA